MSKAIKNKNFTESIYAKTSHLDKTKSRDDETILEEFICTPRFTVFFSLSLHSKAFPNETRVDIGTR